MFERFTPPARQIVFAAQEQARELGHDYIGTEHLLLALLRQPESVPATALTDLGVTYEDAREDVLRIVGRGEGARSGHIPFTPRSKKVLELSLRESLRLKDKAIRPVHLLLGIVREGEGVAALIMSERGVDLRRLRDEVVSFRGGPLPMQTRVMGMPPFSRLTFGGARAADRAARAAGAEPVGTQHFLLAALDDRNSLAAKALDALGVTREAVEAKLAEIDPEGTSDGPRAPGAESTAVRVEGDLVTVAIEEPALAARLRHHLDRLATGVLRGAALPGADALARALVPALQTVATQLERPGPPPEWRPPGWYEAGAATYLVVNQPGGPTTKLLVASGTDPSEVRAWLAEWLRAHAAESDDGQPCLYLTIGVGRVGDVVPEAADPDAFTLSFFQRGAGPGPAHWPRARFGDLVAAALADLSPAEAA
jgi:ATP-dependent Clp protease ATP-binding subunit ClpC